jgi:hypothetical protein
MSEPEYKIKELDVEIKEKFFSTKKKILVKFLLELSTPGWEIDKIKIHSGKFRRPTNIEYNFLKKEYDWIYPHIKIEIIRINPIFKRSKQRSQIINQEVLFSNGGYDVNILEIIISDRKKLIHWFRPK